MHEMSLAEGVVQVLEENATKQGYSQVKKVWLEIGHLSTVEIDSMRFCFEAVTRNTLAENAELEIIEVPGMGVCLSCSKDVEIQNRFDPCPACGEYMVQITGGTEMRVKELEVA